LSAKEYSADSRLWCGKLGEQITTAKGKRAARGVAIKLLATLQAAIMAVDLLINGQVKSYRYALVDGSGLAISTKPHSMLALEWNKTTRRRCHQ